MLSKPVAYLCSSSLDSKALLECSVKLSSKGIFLQLLKNKPKIVERLLPAYLNALLRERDHMMRANSLSMELLLLASSSMNIKKAISEYGISTNKSFILFATDKKLARKFISTCSVKVIKELNLGLITSESSKVAAAEILEE
jgi:tRNA threonylcarbamoyladenosine modification (KEOPS) complex Cgi121 subunit